MNEDGLIDGLTLSPDPLANRPDPSSFNDVETELSEVSDERHILAARVEAGACVPVYEYEAEDTAPIGSAFTLYVLGAPVDAVDSGVLAWDDELTNTPELKSLPSGKLQDEPDGTTVTVDEAATWMISISDNTATDMLIDALGVDSAEAVYDDMGLREPDGLTPLLSTAQLFQLGWGPDNDARTQWADADTDEQRRIFPTCHPASRASTPLP